MRNYKEASSKKIELVPLIDVIFLLLIFFLVTLNIIPILTNKDVLESQYAIPVVTDDDAARVDMLVQLHQFPGDARVHYFTIDSQLPGIPFDDSKLQTLARLSQNRSRLASLRSYFPRHYFREAEDINYEGKKQIIISASPWVPYEHLFKVIQECVNHGIKYYCNIGSFEDFPRRIQFSEPREIVSRYEW
ncbi:biopolymer transporter ExbD [bacterium]|nr:biopolymer transporter ExbD [bacterium]